MKKELKKMSKISYLWWFSTHFLPNMLYLKNGWAQPFGNLQAYFVAIVEQNEKIIKENEQYLIPVVIFHQFPTKHVVS